MKKDRERERELENRNRRRSLPASTAVSTPETRFFPLSPFSFAFDDASSPLRDANGLWSLRFFRSQIWLRDACLRWFPGLWSHGELSQEDGRSSEIVGRAPVVLLSVPTFLHSELLEASQLVGRVLVLPRRLC
ncbi:hypothetical protein DY000_02003138 [Brassica cretica]|uniref:Uncharacterized protein n=1 Tax=Brassica cretica TaxID=69181 RepID=A0ABQ7CLL7_BRACR|nr:hypothetical protein DY000_02003138 [Brassica cretica]